MRRAFVNSLIKICQLDDRVIIISGDLGFGVFDDFKEKYPHQFLNAGIAETNIIGMAAGLALSGYRVFVYSIAPFLVYRAFEQIRDDVCYQNLPVTIVGVGSGLAYGNAGPSHHATEDLALMVSLPNMTVVCPGDPIEVEKAMEKIYKLPGPAYLRLNRSGDKSIHKTDNINFEIGKGLKIEDGSDLLILTTGNTLEIASQVTIKLENVGLSVDLINMHTLKPFDKDALLTNAKGKRLIITIEEHSPFGGLTSIVANFLLSYKITANFLSLTLPDKFAGISGSQEYLRKLYGLDPESVFQRIYEKWKEIGGEDIK